MNDSPYLVGCGVIALTRIRARLMFGVRSGWMESAEAGQCERKSPMEIPSEMPSWAIYDRRLTRCSKTPFSRNRIDQSHDLLCCLWAAEDVSQGSKALPIAAGAGAGGGKEPLEGK